VRRLVLATLLALAFHSLLFTLRFEGPKAKLTHPPKRLILSLGQAPASSISSLAASEVQEPQNEPPPPRPAPPKKPSPQRKVRPAQKPTQKASPSFPSTEEQQDSSFDQAEAVGDEVPRTRPSEGPSHSTQASPQPRPDLTSTKIDRDATPVYHSNPLPEYPLIGRKRGYQGTVIVEVLVNRDGRVGDLRVFASSGYSLLDQAALTTVKVWTFYPGMKAGKKVDMWVKVPVRFRLE